MKIVVKKPGSVPGTLEDAYEVDAENEFAPFPIDKALDPSQITPHNNPYRLADGVTQQLEQLRGSEYFPTAPNLPRDVNKDGRLIPKEVFLQHFDELAEVYVLLSNPNRTDNDRLYRLLHDLKQADPRFDQFAIIAIYGAFALYNDPVKADVVYKTQSTFTEAMNKSHPNHAKLREWIWGLHWSCLHTLSGADVDENMRRFKTRLSHHIFTALNQMDVNLKVTRVEGKEVGEVPAADSMFRPLFDQCIEISDKITKEAFNRVLGTYHDYAINAKQTLKFK